MSLPFIWMEKGNYQLYMHAYGCSNLNYDLCKNNLRNDALCTCNTGIENIAHFLNAYCSYNREYPYLGAHINFILYMRKH